ncbi:TPA: TolC family outer membrane protein [Enterobacter cloacae subsp. dissolvens]|nr:TolC family outer membrane protein [Enterobacter cloacae subsp. dissolvens]
MLNKHLKYIIFLVAFLTSFTAGAITLAQGWFMALDHDSLYRAALKDQLAGEEYISIGRSGLLPKVNVSYQRAPRSWQRQQYQQSNFAGKRSEVVQYQQYDSHSASVTLTQPLLDYEAYADYRIGIIKKMQSDERYRGGLIDLQTRFIAAWLDLSEAHQRLQLSSLHSNALRTQKQVAQRQFESGEGSITDVTETGAALSLAEADEVDASDALEAASVALSAIIGMDSPDTAALPVLSDKPLKLPLVSTHFKYWEQQAMARNPDILAAGHNVEQRRFEIESNRAGHLPRIELYAMHSENDSSSDNTINQKYRTDSIGLRVSMNLFSGGSVSASMRQSASRYEQAKYLHDAQRMKTYSEIKINLNKCLHGAKRVAAYTSAVDAARRQITATQKSILAGQRVNIDLVNAERNLYKTRVDLTVEKHAVIKAWVGLLTKTGAMDKDNMLLLDTYFTH